MRLTRLALSNFRNYAALDFEPAPGLNVFAGANAQGKSNLLEAIALLGTGKSFRTAREGDAVRNGEKGAMLAGEAQVREGTVALACSIQRQDRGARKAYTVNGRGVRYASYLGRLRVVTFVPTDLQLASGPPSLRRAFLNAALAQTQPGYYRDFARYRKTLQQKNALLRGGEGFDPELLRVYDQELIAAGTAVMLARARFVAALAPLARAAHARFALDRETLAVAYDPDVAGDGHDEAAVREAFGARLRAVADRERARGAAIVGPHRDDLRLELDGLALGTYGSQGQQRTAVLALKVAEYAVMREHAREAPLLLLDDVLSELDDERAGAFLGGVGEYEQAFVTSTHVPPRLPSGVRCYRVEAALLREVGAC